MLVRKIKTDPAVQKILDVLTREYGAAHPRAKIDAYRYNKYSIRLRIVDPDFSKLHWGQRTELIWDLLRKELPDRILIDISFIIFLTPKETKRSAMNMEFEDPSPDYDD